jgi:SAM-dependent methyltransferase
MTAATLLEQWTREAAEPFEGWDFSHIADRVTEAEPPWDYLALAREAVRGSRDLLDVATGGGEILSSLSPFPGRVTATEGYPPNVPVARRRLAPLGVEVFQANTASGMPFADGRFDLVINRHGGFRPEEMHRVLQPGGVFLSQQVDGRDNLADLIAAFDARPMWPHNTLGLVSGRFSDLGCTIVRAEAWRGPVTFADVGALVYFLKAVPWVVEGFDVTRHLEVLEALERQRAAGRPLRFTYSRFLIEARKPG